MVVLHRVWSLSSTSRLMLKSGFRCPALLCPTCVLLSPPTSPGAAMSPCPFVPAPVDVACQCSSTFPSVFPQWGFNPNPVFDPGACPVISSLYLCLIVCLPGLDSDLIWESTLYLCVRDSIRAKPYGPLWTPILTFKPDMNCRFFTKVWNFHQIRLTLALRFTSLASFQTQSLFWPYLVTGCWMSWRCLQRVAGISIHANTSAVRPGTSRAGPHCSMPC